MLGIMAAVVISAINPQRQLCQARNSKRDSDARELKNALIQYLIDNAEYPNNPPTGVENAIDICAYGAADTSGCIVMDALIDQDYLVSLQPDPDEENVNFIGYQIYRDEPIIEVIATNTCVVTGYGG